LREQYEQATQVKMNKRGRLQVKDSRYKVPTALDLVYLDESPDWCRANKQLQWAGKKMTPTKAIKSTLELKCSNSRRSFNLI
jgi:hypothetical protein